MAVQSCHTLPRASGLHLVTSYDLRDLELAISCERLPLDFERKLSRLAVGTVVERYVEQNSRLILSLLVANGQGLFDLSQIDYERLIRVLAYVRKDEDTVPDYRIDGFKDDAQEIRATGAELKPLLQRFKSWRLRDQVPGLWLRAAAHCRTPRVAAF